MAERIGLPPAGALSVRPTGAPWNRGVDDWAGARLRALQKRWLCDERGSLPVKDDRDVTEQEVQNYNLVLFGDPGSNRFLSGLLPKSGRHPELLSRDLPPVA